MTRPVTAQPPPMLGADYWTAAMERDGYACCCTGACGRAHAKTAGRCDITARRQRLSAAPAAPAAPTGDPIRDAQAEPRAWCDSCLGGVMTAVRRAAKAVETPGEPLFEPDTAAVVAKPGRGTAGP